MDMPRIPKNQASQQKLAKKSKRSQEISSYSDSGSLSHDHSVDNKSSSDEGIFIFFFALIIYLSVLSSLKKAKKIDSKLILKDKCTAPVFNKDSLAKQKLPNKGI